VYLLYIISLNATKLQIFLELLYAVKDLTFFRLFSLKFSLLGNWPIMGKHVIQCKLFHYDSLILYTVDTFFSVAKKVHFFCKYVHDLYRSLACLYVSGWLEICKIVVCHWIVNCVIALLRPASWWQLWRLTVMPLSDDLHHRPRQLLYPDFTCNCYNSRSSPHSFAGLTTVILSV